jgi:NADPH:quinone reductase-like Zn-dependent oxidoreductase
MGGELMRAVVQREYGGPRTWTVERIERPTPGRGEVLVEVEAAAIDRGTWHLMYGEPWLARLAFGLRRPRNPVPGRDLAGTVAALGPGVDGFAIGDRVYGTGAGSLAEYAVAPVAKVAPMPAGCPAERAAVVPVSGQTALQAVCDVARVQPGQRVLVTGASGGVGSFAVQIAKGAGAHVTGVCSAAKAPAVRSLGADRVLDHRVDDPLDVTADARYDVIIDIGGRAPVKRLRRVVTRDGVVVLVGGLGGGKLLAGYERAVLGAMRSPFVPQRIAMLASKEQRTDLERLTAMIESGAVVPLVDSVVPLERAADAMAGLESGRVTGKLAIRVA